MRAAFSFVATRSGIFDIGIGVEGFATGNASGIITGSIGNGSSTLLGNQSFSLLRVVRVPTPTGNSTTAPLPGATSPTLQKPNIQDSFQIGQLAIQEGQTVSGQLRISVTSMATGTLTFPDSISMTLAEVPEPAALGLMALGLAALTLARWSRKA
ncbi:MAG: PEP-CTERM sorting domain-containing protein [Bryobacterales bacterium]|nr:PEP-CTERM sorting domain-containing protein [Bryobacterales bacterium]